MLNSVGSDVDPLTELKTRTNFGRLDFHRLLTGMRENILDRTYMSGLEGTMRTDVGVYFCGPSQVARGIKKTCKAVTTPDVNFSGRSIFSDLFFVLERAVCVRAILALYMK